MARRVKNWFIYHAAVAALFLAGRVPARWVPTAGAWIGAATHALAGRLRRTARGNLARALGLPETARRVRVLARGVFVRLGQNAIEISRLLRGADLAPRVEMDAASRQALERALAAGRGVIYVTGHLGNWELMALHLARAGYPISTVARESYDPRFTRLMDRFRGAANVDVVYRGRPGASAGMIRALKKGRILGVFIDQDTRVPGAFVPFFGVPAHTPIGAAALASRTGAAVVVGTTRRAAGGGHVIEVAQCSLPDDETEATAKLSLAIEERIRRHPTQWVWFHERWKTRPPGETAA